MCVNVCKYYHSRAAMGQETKMNYTSILYNVYLFIVLPDVPALIRIQYDDAPWAQAGDYLFVGLFFWVLVVVMTVLVISG